MAAESAAYFSWVQHHHPKSAKKKLGLPRILAILTTVLFCSTVVLGVLASRLELQQFNAGGDAKAEFKLSPVQTTLLTDASSKSKLSLEDELTQRAKEINPAEMSQGLYIHQKSKNSSLPEPVCLEDSCLDQLASLLARSFPDRHEKSSWCIHTSERDDSKSIDGDGSKKWQGMLLVKVPKAASSTCAGVVLRIANHTQCAVQYQHREAHEYQNISSKTKFIVGSIRNPGQRAFSTVWFFILSPLNITPSDGNVIAAMNSKRGGKTKGKGGYQYNYLSLEPVPPRSVWNPEYPTLIMNPMILYAKLNRLINAYDFLLVVERMDESLVALALILDIPLHYVLVNHAKVSGQFILNRFGPKSGECYRPRKQSMSLGVQNYLRSPSWLAMNYADEILWRSAVVSLDRTIVRLGRSRFDKALQEYQALRQFVVQTCDERVGTGCTANGIPIVPREPCYDRDFNCGYQCMDKAASKFLDEAHDLS